MTTTVEQLEQRLAAVEEEVRDLRLESDNPPLDETAAERGKRMLREARASQPVISAAIDKAFKEMGISGEPIGAEKVQAMIAASGVKPEENEFSREIIAMREE